MGDEAARLQWGRWNKNRTEIVHSFGKVEFPECTDPAALLALTRAALAEAVKPKVSYEVEAAYVEGGDAGLGDTVAVVDADRGWRLKARIVKRVRTFGETVTCRVTIGSAQRADYEVASALAADVASLQDDVAGIDGQISAATSTGYVDDTISSAVEEAVADAIESLVYLEDLEF